MTNNYKSDLEKKAQLRQWIAEFTSDLKIIDCLHRLAPDFSLDLAELLWAVSGCESSFGIDTKKRHEKIYCDKVTPPGKYSRALIQEVGEEHHTRYGCGWHCSYGPLQILAVNAFKQMRCNPELLRDDYVAFWAGATFLVNEIIIRQGARSIREIGDAYNSGNFRDSIVPVQYMDKLSHFYFEAMNDAKTSKR